MIAKGSTVGRSTTSLRLDDELRTHLTEAAHEEGTSVTALVERFVREGLATAAHPGVIFKPGPAGRRAALAGGPDVWEVIAALRETSGTESERVAAVAEGFGLHERQVVIALNYAAEHPAEIDGRIVANERALDAAERERLLA
jgi:hypothetical protein